MKKLLLYIAALTVAVGCDDMIEELDVVAPSTPSAELVSVKLSLTAEESASTRIAIGDAEDGERSLEWEVGDKIKVYSIENDAYTNLTAEADPDDGEIYFEGYVYPGDNRVYTGNIVGGNTDGTATVYMETSSSTSVYPKMVSSEVINIPSTIEDDSTDTTQSHTIEPIDVNMVHFSAMVNFELKFTNTLTLKQWEVLVGSDGFTISYIYLGGDPDGNTGADGYVDVKTKVTTDPYEEDVEGDSFIIQSEAYDRYNTGYNVSFMTYDADSYIVEDEVISFELPVDYTTFAIARGEKLKVALDIMPKNGNANIDLTTYIENNTSSDFTVERASYNTITKTVDVVSAIFDDSWMAYAATSFAGGDGESAATAFEINTAEQLALLAKNVYFGDDTTDVYYKLTGDNIDLSAHDWTPIGRSNYTFKGNFDGDDKTISGLKISTSDSFQGLFGYAEEGATIENVKISEPSISGKNHVGAVVGYALSSTTISNCAVAGGTISGALNVGGVVGYASSSSSITSCYNTAAVTGSGNNVGGVVGYASTTSSVVACYNMGKVTGSGDYIGGLVGQAGASSVSIIACYNVGGVSDGTDDAVEPVAAAGTRATTGTMGYILGGVATSATSVTPTITQCYYIASVELNDYDADRRLPTVAALNDQVDDMNAAAVAELGGDASDYFETGDGDTLPGLGTEDSDDDLYFNDEGITATEAGTVGNPHLIKTAEELYNLATGVNDGTTPTDGVYWKIDDDVETLDLSTYSSWTPIGTSSNTYYFKGHFNGNGKTISGLKIDASTTDYQGLFGYVSGATIKNITLSAPEISGGNNTGAIVGNAIGSSTISNCHVVGGSVTGSEENVGGIAGYLDVATVTGCSNSSSVECTSSSQYYVGGIVGYSSSSSITKCYNTGDVEGSGSYNYSCIGGIVGQNSTSTISECYNTGAVSATANVAFYIGGIAGYNRGNSISSPYGVITACYNTGKVSSSSTSVSDVGGVIGHNADYTKVTACYNTGELSSSASGSSIGGVNGFCNQNNVTVSACYYVSSSVIGETNETYYGTHLTSVQGLNNVVGLMNEAAGVDYYTAGSPSGSVLPYLTIGESSTFDDTETNTLPTYTPGSTLAD